MFITVPTCADAHQGELGHPANDATPGWRQRWDAIPEPKICAGDMTELIQFPDMPRWQRVPTTIDGNHDRGACGRRDLIIGDTLWIHGDQLDPWLVKWVGRPITRIIGLVEWFWPDVDVRFGQWCQKHGKGGRYGEFGRYARKAVALAKSRRRADGGPIRQVVFGHLHQLAECDLEGVHVVCCGCCCNDHLDIVPITVEVTGTHPEPRRTGGGPRPARRCRQRSV